MPINGILGLWVFTYCVSLDIWDTLLCHFPRLSTFSLYSCHLPTPTSDPPQGTALAGFFWKEMVVPNCSSSNNGVASSFSVEFCILLAPSVHCLDWGFLQLCLFSVPQEFFVPTKKNDIYMFFISWLCTLILTVTKFIVTVV